MTGSNGAALSEHWPRLTRREREILVWVAAACLERWNRQAPHAQHFH